MTDRAITRFEEGKVYELRFVGDSDLKPLYKIIKRTKNFVTVQKVGETATKRTKIRLYYYEEYCYPLGKYSMAPTLKASRLCIEEPVPVPPPSSPVMEAAKELDKGNLTYTPGPWFAISYAKWFCIQTEDFYGETDLLDGDLFPNAHKNAQLMAAAPDLLWSIKQLLSMSEDAPILYKRQVRDLAQKFVNKAEGGPK